MNEKSVGVGIAVAIGVGLMLIVPLLVVGGIVSFLFLRQSSNVKAEAERARVAEQRAQQFLANAQVMEQLVTAPISEPKPFAVSAEQESIGAHVETIMRAQQQAWNAGDLDEFMKHYWKSDELTFSSGGETTRGWDATMKRYQERYPTPEKMGKLKFDKLEVTPLGDSAALVLGQWELDRDSEPLKGTFSLVARKIGDSWQIVHDHTSRQVE